MFLPSLILVATFIGIGAMPYQVPLQGLQGGKRTLVLLDAMVSRLYLPKKIFSIAQKKQKRDKLPSDISLTIGHTTIAFFVLRWA